MKKHPIAARLCAVALAVVCVAGLDRKSVV